MERGSIHDNLKITGYITGFKFIENHDSSKTLKIDLHVISPSYGTIDQVRFRKWEKKDFQFDQFGTFWNIFISHENAILQIGLIRHFRKCHFYCHTSRCVLTPKIFWAFFQYSNKGFKSIEFSLVEIYYLNLRQTFQKAFEEIIQIFYFIWPMRYKHHQSRSRLKSAQWFTGSILSAH